MFQKDQCYFILLIFGLFSIFPKSKTVFFNNILVIEKMRIKLSIGSYLKHHWRSCEMINSCDLIIQVTSNIFCQFKRDHWEFKSYDKISSVSLYCSAIVKRWLHRILVVIIYKSNNNPWPLYGHWKRKM